jgi:hypothetical protein
MPYRRRPDDTVWHNSPDCWNWPGGSYDGRSELPPGGVVCFECSDRRRAALDYVPPLSGPRKAPDPVIGTPAPAHALK